MTEHNEANEKPKIQEYLPPTEVVQQELAKTVDGRFFRERGDIRPAVSQHLNKCYKPS